LGKSEATEPAYFKKYMFSGLYSEIISIISEYSLLKRLFPEKPHTNQPFQNSIFIHKPRSKSIIEYFFKKERKETTEGSNQNRFDGNLVPGGVNAKFYAFEK
jgi:hypothetical protein